MYNYHDNYQDGGESWYNNQAGNLNNSSWAAPAQYRHFNVARSNYGSASSSWRPSAYDRPYPRGPAFRREPAYHPYNGPVTRPSTSYDLGPYSAQVLPGYNRPDSPDRIRREQRLHDAASLEEFKIDCYASSRKVEISWKPPGGRNDHTVEYELICMSLETGRVWYFNKPWSHTGQELKTSPGESYSIDLRCKRDGIVIAKAERTIRAVFSYDELKMLYQKCIEFAGSMMQPFTHLYRCKPKYYFDDIHFNRNDIMEKYIKDKNGQPANHINDIIKGLFFSARLSNDGSLPLQSPFGDVRMLIPGITLLDPRKHNFYFADFYCNYVTHYVTVVICVKDSDTDRYCQPRLMRLNPEDNPFIKITAQRYGETWFAINRGIWVEVFYTENIPLEYGHFGSIVAIGAGTSKIGGLPNNKTCRKCNLYPTHEEEAGEPDVEEDTAKKAVEKNALSNDAGEDATSNELGDAVDVTVEDRGSNSTFRLLMKQDLENLFEEWEDLVEVVCSLVDTVVCEQEPNLRSSDPIAYGDDLISGTLKEMSEDVAENGCAELQRAANSIMQLFEEFKSQRQELARRVQGCHLLVNLIGLCQAPADDDFSRRVQESSA